MVYHGWTASRHHLSAIDPTSATVTFSNPSELPIGHWANTNSEGGGRYFVENIRDGLDQPNEWYFDADSHTLLLKLAQGKVR
jgi:hypothetical protein